MRRTCEIEKFSKFFCSEMIWADDNGGIYLLSKVLYEFTL
jgi:hypothetical protein